MHTMETTHYSTRLTHKIQACLANIISSDAASIVAEYSLRTEQEKLICVLKTTRCASTYNDRTNSIHFLTDGFSNGKITKFALQITGNWTNLENKHYSVAIFGPDGEICISVDFNDLCPSSSYWIRHSPGLLQTTGIEYRKQMTKLMSQF